MALEEEAMAFTFGAMWMVKSSKRLEKAQSFMGSEKSQELCSNTGLNEDDE